MLREGKRVEELGLRDWEKGLGDYIYKYMG